MDWRDVRVVFQDIDGCLNPPESHFPDGAGQSPSPEQARLLREIRRAIDDSSVSQVVLNTGRALACMDFVVDALGSSKVRYLLAEHGAVAVDTADGKLIDLHAIATRHGPPERAARYEQLGPIRDAIAWYQETGESKLSAHFGCPLPALPKAANLTLMIPHGVPSEGVSRELERALTENSAIDAAGFSHHSNELYVDVVGNVDKGDGALLLVRELDVHASEVLAMGDGENDIPLFEVVEATFCPANSAARLKQLCERKGGVVSSRHSGEAALELYRRLG